MPVLGDFEILRVNETPYWWDGGALFGVVPKALWSRKIPADELNRIPLAFNCYLIRTGSHNILIETGLGDKRDQRERERMRIPAVTQSLPEVIAAQGIDPESIDIVINSHLHWDHCSGNTILRANAVAPAFPRARYYAPRGEWEHAHARSVRDAVAYIDANYDPLVESGLMTLVAGDYQVLPGIWMRMAPGHTRDMMVVTAESAGETFCFLSDLVPTVAHLPPTWLPAFDLYPLETIATKVQWLGAAADGGWLCGFGHDAAAFSRIARDETKQFIVAAV
jgi:glyoxylase-like metal-dependent hydrolase (beta-lactamase superfamily II)